MSNTVSTTTTETTPSSTFQVSATSAAMSNAAIFATLEAFLQGMDMTTALRILQQQAQCAGVEGAATELKNQGEAAFAGALSSALGQMANGLCEIGAAMKMNAYTTREEIEESNQNLSIGDDGSNPDVQATSVEQMRYELSRQSQIYKGAGVIAQGFGTLGQGAYGLKEKKNAADEKRDEYVQSCAAGNANNLAQQFADYMAQFNQIIQAMQQLKKAETT